MNLQRRLIITYHAGHWTLCRNGEVIEEYNSLREARQWREYYQK